MLRRFSAFLLLKAGHDQRQNMKPLRKETESRSEGVCEPLLNSPTKVTSSPAPPAEKESKYTNEVRQAKVAAAIRIGSEILRQIIRWLSESEVLRKLIHWLRDLLP